MYLLAEIVLAIKSQKVSFRRVITCKISILFNLNRLVATISVRRKLSFSFVHVENLLVLALRLNLMLSPSQGTSTYDFLLDES